MLIEAAHHKRSHALTVARTTTARIQTHTELLYWPLLFQYRSACGARVPVLGWGEHTLRGNGASSDPILKASAPAIWELTLPPNRGWCWLLSRGEAPTHTWLHSSPSISSPTSYPRERHNLCSRQIQLSYQSHWVHTDYIGMLPYKDTPSTIQQVTVSPNFRDRES